MEEILPKHIAIIMDGNRRWAKKQGMFALLGHEAGIKSLRSIRNVVLGKGIKYLTVWAFSTENWKRDQKEVQGLLKLFEKYLQDEKEMKDLEDNNVKLKIIGDLEKFPQNVQELSEKVMERLKNGKKLILTVAMSYGGRDEIKRMVKKIVENNISPDQITEETINKNLYTGFLPDPELIIRTGGNKRLSGLMPWQSGYSELYFTDILWPDFKPEDFQKALDWFSEQKRNFGK
ncbi:polyprenyl diphosphate synthase [Patescibacteria group bacterium]